MKLIATDMDGTLLNEKNEVSQENVLAIKMAIEKGIQFVVATGRSYESAVKPLQAVGLTCPIITLNGAATFNLKKQQIRDIPLDVSVCRRILDICQKSNMYVELFIDDRMYSTGNEHFMDILLKMFKNILTESTEDEIRDIIERRFQQEKMQFIKNYEDILTKTNKKIYKLLGFSIDEVNLQNAYKELEQEPGVVITSSGELNLEFNHPEAQKGLALESLANSMGIEMKDVMALGDNLNDKSMLQKAGRGVAMGNAVDEIKEVCKFITKTNNENGVAFAIEEMLKEYDK
ncbi:Cof-type HAD-IIB family hydrolase [Bacillus sp. REN16]|uniref:Cof-type HAD-IIB family hydrolase n=1 Tax=Bacillus sp. REN16 TaxID=2887296 RepID=UPI001E3DF700|nr:Cof-type HAD-IIB family hydrolase [Bacillus sp. REN16]MCC3356823.1 Cof-type HAD-IIB family hydrolase [Bacillus sp. REN16]